MPSALAKQRIEPKASHVTDSNIGSLGVDLSGNFCSIRYKQVAVRSWEKRGEKNRGASPSGLAGELEEQAVTASV
jgi:hypothetical protein